MLLHWSRLRFQLIRFLAIHEAQPHIQYEDVMQNVRSRALLGGIATQPLRTFVILTFTNRKALSFSILIRYLSELTSSANSMSTVHLGAVVAGPIYKPGVG